MANGNVVGVGEAGAGVVHPREVVRRGLREMGEMAAELKAMEERIEGERADRDARGKSDGEKMTWEVEERVRKQRLAAVAEHDQRRRLATEERAAGEKKAKEQHVRGVQGARRTAEEQLAGIKKGVQEGEWLADSLLEGAETAGRKHAKEIGEGHGRAVAALDERTVAVAGVLDGYGLQHLVLEAAPVPTEQTGVMDERHSKESEREVLERLTALEDGLGGLTLAGLFVGIAPYGIGTGLVLAGGVVGQVLGGGGPFDLVRAGIGAGVGFVLAVGGLMAVKVAANKQVKRAYAPVRQASEDARAWAETVRRLGMERVEVDLQTARARREAEMRLVRDRHQPMADRCQATLREKLTGADEELKGAVERVKAAYEKAKGEAAGQFAGRTAELDGRYGKDSESAEARAAEGKLAGEREYAEAREELARRWREGLARVGTAIEVGQRVTGAERLDWTKFDGKGWRSPVAFPPAVRFGEVEGGVGGRGDKRESDKETERQSDRVKEREEGTEGLRHLGTQGRTGGGSGEDGGGGGAGWGGGKFWVGGMLGFGEGASGAMGSLMVDFDRAGREGALSVLRAVMARVLVSMPAGRVRLTMIDPVGLGETFAGFMHLADYDEHLTGPRIWTDAESIDRRMQDMTEHMETVIQKYLRNEYETIDAYNAQAGELAEPYRFLVVADFPTGWSAEALRKLVSVLASGSRCGVHVLVARDARVGLERRVLEDVRAGVTGVEVRVGEEGTEAQRDRGTEGETGGGGNKGKGGEGVRLRWRDEVFGGFEVVGDVEPSDAVLTELCGVVGEGARRANRVEVDVGAVLPAVGQRWTGSTAEEFRVPVGRSGATRLQYLKLGKGVSQHALLAGKTGSGKSTLLHVLVTASALWYSPDEVEFYLIDFKKGVEFKTYVDGKLPHVKAVAVESDREFGLSVLQRLDAELSRRGEMFRKAGVQDIGGYRGREGNEGREGTEALRHSGTEGKRGVGLARVVLVVDEFQEFFVEDDKLAQEAAGLLDRLVRQGRAFGMHVVLGSQTIGGNAGLPRATMGQMAVRVALQTSEADSALILGDGNTAARLLTRPGEAIYNDNGGLPEANSPFQVAWLGEERRDKLLAEVVQEGKKRGWTYDAVVFEGNKPADLVGNRDMVRLAGGKEKGVALIGDPVAIKPTTRVTLRSQPGANVLLIGQQEEAAMATMQAMVMSLAMGGDVRFVVLEGTVEGSGLRGGLVGMGGGGGEESTEALRRLGTEGERGGVVRVDLVGVEYREAEEAIGRVHGEMRRREGEGGDGGERIVVMIYGLQRYRGLRKSGEDFSFSMSGEEKKLSADKMLAEIVKEGPAVGVHVVAWADTLSAVERVFERGLMREFDSRVLFQMSANDSSALIDSPAANRLGQYRGLLFSEEQGTLEKFRPFGVLGLGGRV